MNLGAIAKEVKGSQVVQEALSAERTMSSFGLEGHFYERFKERSAAAPRRVLASLAFSYERLLKYMAKFTVIYLDFWIGKIRSRILCIVN